MAALGRLIGVDRATIQRWEKGSRRIDPARLGRVVKLTSIPAYVLRPDLGFIMRTTPSHTPLPADEDDG